MNPKKFQDTVSIIIPAYNEQNRIISSLNSLEIFLAQTFKQYEIICVDDGSTDRTWELLRNFARNHPIRLIRLGKNSGKGYAVKCGMLNAVGRYRFFTDTDLPYQLDAFLLAMQKFKVSCCDIVTGARDLPESGQNVAVSRVRKLAGSIFSTIACKLVHMDVRDSQCGFKGFTDAAAKKIFSRVKTRGYAFDVEVFVLARQIGLTVCKIPVRLVTQSGSKIRMTRDPFRMVLELFRIALKRKAKQKNSQPSTPNEEK